MSPAQAVLLVTIIALLVWNIALTADLRRKIRMTDQAVTDLTTAVGELTTAVAAETAATTAATARDHLSTGPDFVRE